MGRMGWINTGVWVFYFFVFVIVFVESDHRTQTFALLPFHFPSLVKGTVLYIVYIERYGYDFHFSHLHGFCTRVHGDVLQTTLERYSAHMSGL